MLARDFEHCRFLLSSAIAAPSRLLTVPHLAPPCLFPFLVSSGVPSHLVPVQLVSSLLSPFRLFSSSLPFRRPVAAILAPPVVSWGWVRGGAGRSDPYQLRPFLVDIRSVSSTCQARPANRVGGRGGRRGERDSSMPSICLCGFRAVGAICIYSFG